MSKELKIAELIEKWAPVLNDERFPKINSRNRLGTTARLLENQFAGAAPGTLSNVEPAKSLLEALPTNIMGASSATPSTGNIDIYNPVLVSMLRRTIPNLIAYDMVGVQPMTGPTGLIFSFKPRANSQVGVEVWGPNGLGEANTSFSASSFANSIHSGSSNSEWVLQTGLDPSSNSDPTFSNYTVTKALKTDALEMFGKDATTAFNEMAFTIESNLVEAKGRGLAAGFTRELQQDLRAVHGLDAETELANILTQQILFDINREVVRSINISATIGAQNGVASAGTFNLDVDSDGRWSVEKFKGLIFRLEREANAIAKSTRRGKGNWLICSSDVASALRMTGLLEYNPQLAVDLAVDDTGNTFAGVLNGSIRVYIDPYFVPSAGREYATIGYKGSSEFDAGMFYCPYVPLEHYQAVDPLSFQPRLGYKTRYGLVPNPFAVADASSNFAISFANSNRYFRRFSVLNLT